MHFTASVELDEIIFLKPFYGPMIIVDWDFQLVKMVN